MLWLGRDHGLPDGDELGHIGAAAMFVFDLREGSPLRWLWRLWAGDTGEYPGLYPALVSLPWSLLGEGQPGRLPIRLLNPALSLVGAACAARVAARLAPPERRGVATVGAFGAALLMPEGLGLSRHFMPEGALAALAGLSLLAALRAAERPSLGRALQLGLALGLGMLIKQTFVIYALVPAIWGLAKLGRRAGLALLALTAVAGPWYLGHLDAQLAYGAASAPADGAAPLWLHLVYYPLALAWTGLGPALALALVLAGRRIYAALPLVTLVLALALLTGIPKKYPRLLAPVGPVAAVALGLGLSRTRRPALHAALWGGAAGAWVGLGSVSGLPMPGPIRAMASGCVQRWLAPPQADDLGIADVVEAVGRARASSVLVIDPPEIPCELQTTLPWLEHLRPALEHAGLDVRVMLPGEEGAESASLEVDWRAGPGQERPVPALQTQFWIRPHATAPEAW